MDKDLNDLLDKYAKGQLSEQEKLALEEKANQNESIRQMMDDHSELVSAIVDYGKRTDLKESLNKIHDEMLGTVKPIIPNKSNWAKYWPNVAIAASVALVSILGTILITNSLSSRQVAEFMALRRNIDQIKKSQRILEKDIAATKKKETVFGGNYAGTCFMISKNGYLVTSYHVVNGADSIKIENEKFGTLKATVQYSDPANDVSILRIDTVLTSLPYMVENSEASLAEEVFTLGYPREDIVFGEGAISALTGYNQNPNSYQVSVPVNPGNSGGPLLNSRGNLVGIISGLQTETMGAAFAIKSNVLIDIAMRDTLKSDIVLSKQNTIKNTSRVSLVKQWKEFVFMVRVYKTN